MSELVRGSLVPLFDRFVPSEGAGGAGAFILLPEQLTASIARDLGRLFNTRNRLGLSEIDSSTGTVVDYGIPDFSALSPRSEEDRRLLQKALLKSISFYEPRLKNVAVKVEEVEQRGDSAAVTVSGDITIGLHHERVSFSLSLNPSQDAVRAP